VRTSTRSHGVALAAVPATPMRSHPAATSIERRYHGAYHVSARPAHAPDHGKYPLDGTLPSDPPELSQCASRCTSMLEDPPERLLTGVRTPEECYATFP
jgi:hypothetical protein